LRPASDTRLWNDTGLAAAHGDDADSSSPSRAVSRRTVCGAATSCQRGVPSCASFFTRNRVATPGDRAASELPLPGTTWPSAHALGEPSRSWWARARKVRASSESCRLRAGSHSSSRDAPSCLRASSRPINLVIALIAAFVVIS